MKNFYSLFGRYYYLILKKIKDFLNIKKYYAPLILNSVKANQYLSLFELNNTYKNNYKLIIIGSLYNYLKNFKDLYDAMNALTKEYSISPDSVLYVPHPRLSNDIKNIIKVNYGWKISNSNILVEELIYNNKDKFIWSTMSTSLIYLKFYIDIDCRVFF